MHFSTVHSTCAFECVTACLCVTTLVWELVSGREGVREERWGRGGRYWLLTHGAAISLRLLPLIHSNISHSPQTQECGRFSTLRCTPAAFPAQVPAAGSLKHEMQAACACTGHVLQEQTHTGLLHGEVASIPRRAFGKKHKSNGHGVCCKHRSVTVQVQKALDVYLHACELPLASSEPRVNNYYFFSYSLLHRNTVSLIVIHIYTLWLWLK